MAEELERKSDSMSKSATKSTKRGMCEKYTPNEKAETSCYAWYHCHNKASPCLAKLCSNHEIFNMKINDFANVECFTKCFVPQNLELYSMPTKAFSPWSVTIEYAHGIIIYCRHMINLGKIQHCISPVFLQWLQT